MLQSITWLSGLARDSKMFRHILTSDASAREVFEQLWKIRYRSDVDNLSPAQRFECAQRVAKDNLCDLLRSKQGAAWRSACCLVVEKHDGSITCVDLAGNEHAPLISSPFSGDLPPEFWAAFAEAGLAALRARRTLGTAEPFAVSVSVAFAARFGNGQSVAVVSERFCNDESTAKFEDDAPAYTHPQ